MNNTLRYPAVFFPDGGAISVFFPDIDTITCGDDIDHAYEMAKEALGIWIEENLGKNKPPVPTTLTTVIDHLKNGLYNDDAIKHDENSIVMLVEVEPKYLKRTQNRAVKVNTSIPAWLKAEADRNDINISQVLQNALKKELNI